MSEHEALKAAFTKDIPDTLLLRGVAPSVLLSEVTAFDVMPRIIGAAFMQEELRPRVHFMDELPGTIQAKEAALTILGEQELAVGSLNKALDAYRRGLYYRVRWRSAHDALEPIEGTAILLAQEGLELMNLGGGTLGLLEAQLAGTVWGQKHGADFNFRSYKQFTEDIRRLEVRYRHLKVNFNYGIGGLEHNPDPELGRQYIAVCVAMNRHKEAAAAAKKLGWTEEAESLLAEAQHDPQENPRYEELLRAKREEFDKGSGT